MKLSSILLIIGGLGFFLLFLLKGMTDRVCGDHRHELDVCAGIDTPYCETVREEKPCE